MGRSGVWSLWWGPRGSLMAGAVPAGQPGRAGGSGMDGWDGAGLCGVGPALSSCSRPGGAAEKNPRRGPGRGGLAGWGVQGLHTASPRSSAGEIRLFPPQQPSSEQPPGGAG